MTRIGLLSDTHGYLDPNILIYLEDCEEIWHAGDFGTIQLSDTLSSFRKLRGVYGNIDDQEIRSIHPLNQLFTIEDLKVKMMHIGGYPGHYPAALKKEIKESNPDLFICGHSHILKIIQDNEMKMLTINPGAAGKHGFHRTRTIVKFDITGKKIENMKVIELGKRA